MKFIRERFQIKCVVKNVRDTSCMVEGLKDFVIKTDYNTFNVFHTIDGKWSSEVLVRATMQHLHFPETASHIKEQLEELCESRKAVAIEVTDTGKLFVTSITPIKDDNFLKGEDA